MAKVQDSRSSRTIWSAAKEKGGIWPGGETREET